jgi:signal transduction histidine kinase
MPAPIVTYRPPWQVGSKLSIQGVCELEFTPRKPGTNSPLLSGFNLWMRSPADVTVVSGPPWWTPQRLAIALGGMGAVLILALGWNLLLHRKVDEQMAVISSKLRSETIHTERNRLASDLHDTLEQQLVGVALQLDDAEQIMRQDPETAREVVGLARRMLRHTRLEARRSVWDLRSKVLESDGLAAALKALAESVVSPSGPTVEGQHRPASTVFSARNGVSNVPDRPGSPCQCP